MLGEREELAHDQLDNPLAVLRFAILDDMLGDIVAVLVSNQNLGRSVELAHDFCLVFLGAVFQQSLNDAAAIGVGCQRSNLAAYCIHDEVDVLPWDKLNDLLDNMVAILVFDYS